MNYKCELMDGVKI